MSAPRRLAFSALLAVVACQGVPRALDASPATARAVSDEALLALACRFGPVQLEPRFAELRPRFARAALVPSRVYDDGAAWTGSARSTRTLGFTGTPGAGGAYSLGVAERPAAPAESGEYRGLLQLDRLGSDEFRWRMHEELAVGPLTTAQLAAAVDALLQVVESLPPGDARPALRQSLPRTSAALGRLFGLERLGLAAMPDGGRLVDGLAVLHPEGIDQVYPHYAGFLRRHVMPLRFTTSIEDPLGAPFWEAEFADGRAALRLRVRNAELAPLAGAPRRLGERFFSRSEMSMKAGLFRMGLGDLVGEVERIRRGHGGDFRVSFKRQPDWQLPFIVEPLLRASLRRPFEGEGAVLSYGLQDADAALGLSSTVSRDFSLAVKESWLLRWLGGNVGSTVADFRRGPETEADRFVREAILALRDDVRALIGPS